MLVRILASTVQKQFTTGGCRGRTTAFYRPSTTYDSEIELQRCPFALIQSLSYGSFEQRLDDERDEEDEHVGLDTLDLLKQQGRGAMNMLELLESLF